tara:strand:- start:5707 stop:6009 length:303 start_codon:yes stop_codon:yes gene_type:complete
MVKAKTVKIDPVATEIKETPPVVVVKKARKPNMWLIHVKAYREKNPTISYKDCLKNAKLTYKKLSKVTLPAKPVPIKKEKAISIKSMKSHKPKKTKKSKD